MKSKLDKVKLKYEETEIKMTNKETKKDKKQNTLSIYTYMNWKRFGVSVAIDDGIKINIAWFETNIKFEKK